MKDSTEMDISPLTGFDFYMHFSSALHAKLVLDSARTCRWHEQVVPHVCKHDCGPHP